jgi:hypothetical protein
MSNDRTSSPRDFDLGFSFVSYGITVGLASDDPVLLDKARDLLARAFGDRAKIFEEPAAAGDPTFGIAHETGLFKLYKNGFEITSGSSEKVLFRYLSSLLRIEVAELAEGKVFLHAGVVGWNGQAIVFPAKSFSGKSTLTAELIRNGAEYYSDDFAVIEENGFVGPFPRHLSLRYFGSTRVRDVPPEELGTRIGKEAIPIGMVLLTSFSKGAKWEPEILTPGAGMLEIIANTMTMRRDPAFSLKVLDLVARRAIIVSSPRGDVKKFAKFLLAFFDKHSKLAKMT